MKKIILALCLVLSVVFTACGTSSTDNKSSSGQANTDSSKQSDVATSKAFDADIKNNALAINPQETIAVVANSSISEIKIYDLKNQSVMTTLTDFITPRNIEFSKDGKHFYISDSTHGNIREYDSNTFKLVRTFALEQGVFGFTLTNSGDKIFANNQALSTVSVIDLTTGTVSKKIEGFDQPRQGIIIDANDQFVYVTNFKGDDVRVVNTKTLAIEKTLKGIPAVRAISVDKKGKYLYGASSSSNTINVVDIQTGELAKSIPVGKEPYGSNLSPDGKIILTGEKASNQVSVIDTETLTVKLTIGGLDEPRQAIKYSNNDGQAYVLNKDLSISLIDYVKGTILKNIK